MNDLVGAQVVSEDGLAEIVRVLDGANVIVHGQDGVISRWTAGCEQNYGWTRQEAVGRVVHDLLDTVFPEPLEHIRAEVRTRGAWNGELTHRHKDGTLVRVASRWLLSLRQNRETT